MALIKGIDVVLYEQFQTGVDPFNKPIFEEKETTVSNVLVEPVSQTEILANYSLDTTRTAYRLCIPKGDNHDWKNKKIKFMNRTFQSYTDIIEYIDDNVPLEWNKKVLVEEIE